jgi:predicted RNase H-like HicB family nuclease
MKTFVLKVVLKEEDDGRWSASIPALPGCSSWGYSKQEALDNIKDAAEIYIEDMIDAGEGIPTPSDKIEVIDEPAVAVSL